jgi:hypothetical protein
MRSGGGTEDISPQRHRDHRGEDGRRKAEDRRGKEPSAVSFRWSAGDDKGGGTLNVQRSTLNVQIRHASGHPDSESGQVGRPAHNGVMEWWSGGVE